MADKGIDDTLTELERMEVDRRRRKQIGESFRGYMESPEGQKLLESSTKRLQEVKPRKRVAPTINIEQDDKLLTDMKF